MGCGEQRVGLGRAKRAIALLFLEWLAANLNAHPCRRLRNAQKPRPPASVQAQHSIRDRCDDDDNHPAQGAVSVLRGRVSVSSRGDHAMAGTLPAQHALALARASILPLTDGLFVCNSHIGMDGKEAMTRNEAACLAPRGARELPPNCHLRSTSPCKTLQKPHEALCFRQLGPLRAGAVFFAHSRVFEIAQAVFLASLMPYHSVLLPRMGVLAV